ncbi:MAG TPA: GNAT family N-acetyltransferase [Thermoleophilaceae bacterium]|nr:GNAT family N-acetyltransferase [Thermoleophilaceae bacterium]
MLDRVFESMFHWYRLVGGASEGARVFERDGVVAAVVPAAPERAVVNAVLYRSADGLEAAYDELGAAYEEIGAKWTVWVAPGDDAAAALLESRGHYLDARPMAMARELDGVERPPPDALANWTAEGELAAVGRVNDRSYTFGTDSFSRSLQTLPDGAAHVYVASDEAGEPIGCLTVVDHHGNSEVQLVAVVPEARGQGITRRLLGHALADAAERGSETSTLIATPLGYPVYERLGYRPLERVAMWERAPA